jgi:hypothetical protein
MNLVMYKKKKDLFVSLYLSIEPVLVQDVCVNYTCIKKRKKMFVSIMHIHSITQYG